MRDQHLIGFHNLPRLPSETLSTPERFNAFLEYTIVAWNVDQSDSAVKLWQSALRSAIVLWNPRVYDSVIRIMKQELGTRPDWKPLVWYYEAWHQFAAGETESAITTYERCIRTWEQLGLVEEAAEVKVALARIFQATGDLKRAIELYRQSVKVLLVAETSRDRAAALALHNLADVLLARLELEDAETYCRQSLSLLSAGDDPSAGYSRSTSLRNLGNVHRIRGEWAKAMEYYERSLISARKRDDQSDEANTLNCMADTHLQIGKYSVAESLFRASLEIHTELQEQVWVALGLSGLGELAGHRGRTDEALRLLDEAEEILKSTAEHRHLSSVFRRKISIHLEVGEYSLAEELVQKARALLNESGDLRAQAYLDEQEGWLNLETGQLDLAEPLLSQSLRAFRQARIRHKESDLLFAIGALREYVGDLPEALELFEQSAALAKEADYSDRAEEAASAARRLHRVLER